MPSPSFLIPHSCFPQNPKYSLHEVLLCVSFKLGCVIVICLLLYSGISHNMGGETSVATAQISFRVNFASIGLHFEKIDFMSDKGSHRVCFWADMLLPMCDLTPVGR